MAVGPSPSLRTKSALALLLHLAKKLKGSNCFSQAAGTDVQWWLWTQSTPKLKGPPSVPWFDCLTCPPETCLLRKSLHSVWLQPAGPKATL